MAATSLYIKINMCFLDFNNNILEFVNNDSLKIIGGDRSTTISLFRFPSLPSSHDLTPPPPSLSFSISLTLSLPLSHDLFLTPITGQEPICVYIFAADEHHAPVDHSPQPLKPPWMAKKHPRWEPMPQLALLLRWSPPTGVVTLGHGCEELPPT